MQQSKVILINGPAGSGKTTIANRYISEHSLALSIAGDEVIAMLGRWREYEEEARMLKFELIKSMLKTHVRSGHDVLLPYLLTDSQHAEEFENIAHEHGARFVEVVLLIEKEEAVTRLLERGVWGEPGSKQLTDEDRPNVESLYDKMVAATAMRPNTISITPEKGQVEETYQAVLKAIES